MTKFFLLLFLLALLPFFASCDKDGSNSNDANSHLNNDDTKVDNSGIELENPLFEKALDFFLVCKALDDTDIRCNGVETDDEYLNWCFDFYGDKKIYNSVFINATVDCLENHDCDNDGFDYYEYCLFKGLIETNPEDWDTEGLAENINNYYSGDDNVDDTFEWESLFGGYTAECFDVWHSCGDEYVEEYGGDYFPDDFCITLEALILSAKKNIRSCFDKPCDEIDECMVINGALEY